MIRCFSHVGAARIHKGLATGLIFSVSLVLLLVACGGNAFESLADDDSDEAKLEAARMALDASEFTKAAQLLDDMLDDDPNDAQLLVYLSHAYGGMAGLDTFDLLTIIDDLEAGGAVGSIDMVGLLLGDSDGNLTTSDVDTIVQHLNNAIETLELVETSGPFTDDETVQRGVLAIARTAMVLGQIIISDQGGDTDTITLTESGIATLYNETPDLAGNVSDHQLEQLSEDIVRVQNGILVLETMYSDNDLSEDFDEFERNLNPNGDAHISTQEVENYIDSLI